MHKPLKKLTALTLITLFHLQVFSQSRMVTGKVLSASDSLPLIGASVYIKGTTIGTTVDFDGKFTLNVNSPEDTLVFGFIGMENIEMVVGAQNVFNVVLSEESRLVDEVVVTALGISRKTKSLGYAVDRVDGEELVKGNDKSFLNALQGKVAGVTISSASGAPGSSSRVMIRGVSSLGRSNQPLFIIDGVPASNSFTGSSSINGGVDFGNGANDINPDDIAEMTVLKGSAGTALYGSQAANGVVIITTKKGGFNEKPVITASSSLTMEEPLKLVSYQNEFGQGLNGEYVNIENTSWGPAFDGKVRLWGHEVDSAYRVKPYEALPRNVKEFFDVGLSYNNSVSISGGGELVSYYASYSNIQADGIFPTDADSYERNTFSLRSEQSLSDKFKTSISLNYIRKENSYVATGQGGQSVYNQVMQTPRDVSLLELEDLNDPFNSVDNYYSLYTINPYFILNNSGNTLLEDRIYGNINLSYQLTKSLGLQARLGLDIGHGISESWRPVILPEGNNEFAAIFETGQASIGNTYRQLLNSDFILTYKRDFANEWGIQFVAGNNIYQSGGESLYAEVNGFSVEGHNHLSNSNEPPFVSESKSLKRLVGVYSNLDVSYRSWFFVSFTGRNDWSSTLSKSFFYPGVNTGLVFTDLIPGLQKYISFGKLRAGIAQTGNDAPLYSAENSYYKGVVSDGYGVFRLPIAGVNGYELGNLLGNKHLKPELTSEYEVGLDLRFLNNKIAIDASYYKNSIVNLIWGAPVSAASGFTSKTINLGEIQNEGVEMLLTLNPVKTKLVNWEMTFNFAQNKNVLISLNESTEKVVLTGLGVSGGQQINYIAIPGREIGIFEAREMLRDDLGRIVVDNQGLPRATDDLVEYGDGNYDYTLGLGSQLTIAGLTISGSFDMRQGGIMYSRTKDISAWAGTARETLYNYRQPFIVPNSVVETGRDNNGNPIYVENNKPIDSEKILEFWGNGGYEMDGFALIDKSFIKLREITISYDIPVQKLKRFPLKEVAFNVVGKNLFLWTPEGQNFIDPEVTTFGNDLTSNFGEYSATPSVRSVSFGLRIVL